MDGFRDTYDPKNPPNSLFRPRAHSPVLMSLIGSLIAFFLLLGVAWMFWTVAHPRPANLVERERGTGTTGYFPPEGGHNPNRRPSSTRDELKFRGALTPPSEARGR